MTTATKHQGRVASKGGTRTISGLARVVTSPSELSKVRQGDVLVAEHTDVEYLPAMMKAVAFVTALGGVVCHAAIVAREFNKPCIVACGQGILSVADGTLVTLDLEEGTLSW